MNQSNLLRIKLIYLYGRLLISKVGKSSMINSATLCWIVKVGRKRKKWGRGFWRGGSIAVQSGEAQRDVKWYIHMYCFWFYYLLLSSSLKGWNQFFDEKVDKSRIAALSNHKSLSQNKNIIIIIIYTYTNTIKQCILAVWPKKNAYWLWSTATQPSPFFSFFLLHVWYIRIK